MISVAITRMQTAEEETFQALTLAVDTLLFLPRTTVRFCRNALAGLKCSAQPGIASLLGRGDQSSFNRLWDFRLVTSWGCLWWACQCLLKCPRVVQLSGSSRAVPMPTRGRAVLVLSLTSSHYPQFITVFTMIFHEVRIVMSLKIPSFQLFRVRKCTTFSLSFRHFFKPVILVAFLHASQCYCFISTRWQLTPPTCSFSFHMLLHESHKIETHVIKLP